MAKKKAKTKASSRPPLPDPGFYGAHVGSPQNVEFGKGSDMNYLKPSQMRAEALGADRYASNLSGRKMKEFAEFQGGSTFRFREIK